MPRKNIKFIDCFDNCKFRYIDQTGLNRPPVSSNEVRDDLNLAGYEAYQTVNGFADASNNKKEKCINLNAFFVDIDGRKDPEELEAISKKLEPSFIIETGNGYHIYYLLDEPIYRDEIFGEVTWEQYVERWERIEQSIVTALNGDKVVKDVTRIMRQVNTYYWKKTGEKFKEGVKGIFKIKGVHKKVAASYSMDELEEAFPPIKEVAVSEYIDLPQNKKLKEFAENEKQDFFKKVNEHFPIEERNSFKKLISGKADSLPVDIPSRNQALLVTATLMRQANWSKDRALDHFKTIGWHGIESEKGGWQEIQSTVNSAFSQGYVYSYKNEIIAFNTDSDEQKLIQEAHTAVSKKRREVDKIRFSNYEYEIFARYPHLKKNEIGIVFNYEGGVYKMLSDQQISNLILNALYDDLLWGFRTKKHVSDKLATLLSIIPDLKITEDKKNLFNVKNGLLDIYTKELHGHTPIFISLVQSPVEYKQSASCPTWDQCIESWMEGEESEEKTKLLQQFTGYLLTPGMTYAKALFITGDGGNGKSTFADTIGMVVGDEGTSRIDLEDLYSTFGLKGLIGKRLNIVEEVSGNYYQSHKLKKLISGEEMTINMKYKDQFKFKPTAKFIFSVNIMPRVDDSSQATERRLVIVQFNNNFRDNPNVLLRDSGGMLAQELSGILNWMLDGVGKLKEQKGFEVTTEQKVALLEYREENSSVEGFIGECIVFAEASECPVRELYEEYKQYCVKDGRKFKGNIVFTKEIKAYAKKNESVVFVPRKNGREASKFIGIMIDKTWDSNTEHSAIRNINRVYGK